MFQYAAARAAALLHDTELKMDRSWFSDRPASDTARRYMLGELDITAGFASSREILQTRCIASGRRASFICKLRSILVNDDWGWYREPGFNFDPCLRMQGDKFCMDGYWQSYRYFEDFGEHIRKEFVPSRALAGANMKLAERIHTARSVAVHIRRGDYVNDPAVRMVHGHCTLDYYQKAVRYISERYTGLTFFIFSDDPGWAESNLDFAKPAVIVKHNSPEDAVEDLRLFSFCRHHIIANSTFSWWGAWLCSSEDKTVIAPHAWFNVSDFDTSDLIPSGWVRI